MNAAAPFTPVSRRTVANLLRDGVRAHPDRPFLVYEDPSGEVSSFTWREVLEHASGVVRLLAVQGVGRGDRVHLHLANRPEFLFLWLGAALGGFSIVPTNTAATAEEIAYVTGHAETSVGVTEASHLETVETAAAQREGAVTILCCERDEILGAVAGDRHQGAVACDQELGIIYTSGTTSRPKGAIVNHANYLFAGEVVSKAICLTPEDRLIVALPLFHANAQYYSVMGALTARSTLVLLPRFSASRYVGQCIAHRGTVGSLFSAPIRMILAQDPAARSRAHGLRLMLFAQTLSEAELEQWEREVGAPLMQIYGMTETIGPPLMNPIWAERKPDTVGRVSLGYACRVVDEEGRDAERGELLVAGVPGVSLIAGYLHDEEASAAALAGGWLRTGDVVAVDEDGYFTFVDRNKDMIKRAGENVAASEVEATLLDHPAVREAAVVGVPEEMREEAIVAFVVFAADDTTSEELREWCAKRLAKFRVPSAIVAVEELPRTPVGKVQKHLLRARHRGYR